jgi:hypothetical protein
MEDCEVVGRVVMAKGKTAHFDGHMFDIAPSSCRRRGGADAQ